MPAKRVEAGPVDDLIRKAEPTCATCSLGDLHISAVADPFVLCRARSPRLRAEGIDAEWPRCDPSDRCGEYLKASAAGLRHRLQFVTDEEAPYGSARIAAMSSAMVTGTPGQAEDEEPAD